MSKNWSCHGALQDQDQGASPKGPILRPWFGLSIGFYVGTLRNISWFLTGEPRPRAGLDEPSGHIQIYDRETTTVQAQGLAVCLRQFPHRLSERLNVSSTDCKALFFCVALAEITEARASSGSLLSDLKPDYGFPTYDLPRMNGWRHSAGWTSGAHLARVSGLAGGSGRAAASPSASALHRWRDLHLARHAMTSTNKAR